MGFWDFIRGRANGAPARPHDESARELNELREQQAATAEILHIISRSPANLQAVLDTLVQSAARLCDSYDAGLLLREGEWLVCGAHRGPIPLDWTRMQIGRGWPAGRAVVDRAPVHIHDLSTAGDEFPEGRQLAERMRFRTIFATPLLRGDQAIGALAIRRKEVRPFTPQQINLVTTFAEQAVIAIENARLMGELRESLQQQTATADVLKVISRSTFDLQVVLDTLVEAAVRLCDADMAQILRPREGGYYLAAGHGFSLEYMESHKTLTFVPGRGSVTGRVLLEGKPVQIPDVLADPEYTNIEPQRLGGYRTHLGVPLLRDAAPIGFLLVSRRTVRPFDSKQIELVTTFADQAVIAIENTRLFDEVQARTRELSESLEQQTATSEVLRVISSSPGDLQAVFEAMLEKATRICGAKFGNLFLREGTSFRAVALHGPPTDYVHWYRRDPVLNEGEIAGTPLGRVADSREVLQIADLREEQAYVDKNPRIVAMVESAGARTIIGVPMLKEANLVGVFFIYRQEVRPFTQKEIALLTSFASQAVIAIENTRLLNELRESLQQQTATADVLKVISRSTFNLQTVLDTLVESAARLCEADMVVVGRPRGAHFHFEATFGASPEYQEFVASHPATIDRGTGTGRTLVEGKITHIADVLADTEYTYREAQKIGHYRTLLAVPLLREGTPIGVISLQRKAVRPFTDKQVELVTTFADQAAIAIENTRLLNELRESLQQQTATADVLKVISRSAFDLQTVLDTLVESAARLCGADLAAISRPKGAFVEHLTSYGYTPEHSQFMKSHPWPAHRGSVSGRCLIEGRIVHIPDIQADPDYTLADKERFNVRTILGVPLMREGAAIGVIVLQRSTVRPFSEKQVGLAATFADQAVIAIENARLFDEVQARTRELAQSVEELRALSEVGQAITSTLDVEGVLTTIVTKAVQLSGTDAGAIYTFDEKLQEFRLRATHGMDEGMIAEIRHRRIGADETAIGQAAAERRVLQIPDLLNESSSRVLDIIVRAGYRAVLFVPLLRSDQIIGALVVRRKKPGEFPRGTIELLRTFADQSVLAIQNARLFGEIEQKSCELELASKHKSQFLANMSHELRTPLNAILGYTELILDNVYGETPTKMHTVLQRIETNGKHLLGLINDVLDLSKIEAGQLTLALAPYSLRDVVHSVYSAVEPLAADKKLAFKIDVERDMPGGYGDERRLTQVLLNLVGNAIKFTDQGEIAIRASSANGTFRVAVRDTGPGISETDQQKLFQEFQQADNSITKKKGGTGLGLAISKRIIEMHGGHVSLESTIGQGSTFSFTLPIIVQERARPA
jgi:GAF domain-containing protein